MNKLLCWIRNECRFEIVANFQDITDGRGLYQCSRCKTLTMDVNCHRQMESFKKGHKTRLTKWMFREKTYEQT